TERPGILRRVGKTETAYEIPEAYHIGEGGLLGMALDPDFKDNSYIYLYFTYSQEGEILNRVNRYSYSKEGLSGEYSVISGIPGSRIHNGGRIAFGPDGYLYITAGDAGNSSLAQDRNSLAGTILRLESDGAVPAGNPFNSPVYSYGHRNPQGLAWDDSGRLWATEHGPRGHDELNLIEPGKNYGWPKIKGDETAEGMKRPIIHSGNNTWAPSGALFYDGSIYFAGLRGGSVYEAELKEDEVKLKAHFENRWGRLRNVTKGPDGNFYLLSSNRDGRGLPDETDDKVIVINPELIGKP
ncbi:MAG: PQQ-dependent sugar dehydrogenase, partial [Elusimicrobiota bacterium]